MTKTKSQVKCVECHAAMFVGRCLGKGWNKDICLFQKMCRGEKRNMLSIETIFWCPSIHLWCV